MTVLGRSAQRHATGTARRSRTRLVTVFAGLAAALGVLGMPGAAVAAAPIVSVSNSPAGPVDPGTSVTFEANASDPDDPLGLAGPLTYAWGNCGGGTDSSTSCQVSGRGTFQAFVTVTDANGEPTPRHGEVTVRNVAPTIDTFTVPGSAHTGAAFNVAASASDDNGDTVSYTWSIDGTPVATGPTATLTLGSTGSHSVSVTASDPGAGSLSTTRSATVNATNQNPKAVLAVTPNPAAVGSAGATVSFNATASTDADADALSYVWDFGDDSPLVTTPSPQVTHLYAATGNYPVVVSVRDPWGGQGNSKTIVLQVVASPLTASFTYAPIAPVVGAAITFTSTSVGPDSSITSQTWDLDNDGQFDDASGPATQWSFGAAGSYQVSLKVVNAKGVSSVAFQTINVTGPATAQSPASSASATPQGTPSLRRLNPFPIVRIRGRIVAGAARITLLTVKAPKGAKIRVLCKGRGCPYSRKASTARSTTRALRFRAMERRLRPGTIITVMVTKSNRIGKYTRFRIRSGAAPVRLDRCLAPGSFKPVKCSSLR